MIDAGVVVAVVIVVANCRGYRRRRCCNDDDDDDDEQGLGVRTRARVTADGESPRRVLGEGAAAGAPPGAVRSGGSGRGRGGRGGDRRDDGLGGVDGGVVPRPRRRRVGGFGAPRQRGRRRRDGMELRQIPSRFGLSAAAPLHHGRARGERARDSESFWGGAESRRRRRRAAQRSSTGSRGSGHPGDNKARARTGESLDRWGKCWTVFLFFLFFVF